MFILAYAIPSGVFVFAADSDQGSKKGFSIKYSQLACGAQKTDAANNT